MHAMRASEFKGYEGLKLVEVAKPQISDGKVLVRNLEQVVRIRTGETGADAI